MDRPRDHTTWSKSEREREISYNNIHMWNLKYDTNKLICEIERLRKSVWRIGLWLLGMGVGREGGMDKEFGISRCKLLYTEWINKVPPYSTGNYIQYPIISHNGKKDRNKKHTKEKRLSAFDLLLIPSITKITSYILFPLCALTPFSPPFKAFMGIVRN